eukprot:PhM_4_TR4328/c0_g1_i1/m.34987
MKTRGSSRTQAQAASLLTGDASEVCLTTRLPWPLCVFFLGSSSLTPSQNHISRAALTCASGGFTSTALSAEQQQQLQQQQQHRRLSQSISITPSVAPLSVPQLRTNHHVSKSSNESGSTTKTTAALLVSPESATSPMGTSIYVGDTRLCEVVPLDFGADRPTPTTAMSSSKRRTSVSKVEVVPPAEPQATPVVESPPQQKQPPPAAAHQEDPEWMRSKASKAVKKWEAAADDDSRPTTAPMKSTPKPAATTKTAAPVAVTPAPAAAQPTASTAKQLVPLKRQASATKLKDVNITASTPSKQQQQQPQQLNRKASVVLTQPSKQSTAAATSATTTTTNNNNNNNNNSVPSYAHVASMSSSALLLAVGSANTTTTTSLVLHEVSHFAFPTQDPRNRLRLSDGAPSNPEIRRKLVGAAQSVKATLKLAAAIGSSKKDGDEEHQVKPIKQQHNRFRETAAVVAASVKIENEALLRTLPRNSVCPDLALGDGTSDFLAAAADDIQCIMDDEDDDEFDVIPTPNNNNDPTTTTSSIADVNNSPELPLDPRAAKFFKTSFEAPAMTSARGTGPRSSTIKRLSIGSSSYVPKGADIANMMKAKFIHVPPPASQFQQSRRFTTITTASTTTTTTSMMMAVGKPGQQLSKDVPYAYVVRPLPKEHRALTPVVATPRRFFDVLVDDASRGTISRSVLESRTQQRQKQRQEEEEAERIMKRPATAIGGNKSTRAKQSSVLLECPPVVLTRIMEFLYSSCGGLFSVAATCQRLRRLSFPLASRIHITRASSNFFDVDSFQIYLDRFTRGQYVAEVVFEGRVVMPLMGVLQIVSRSLANSRHVCVLDLSGVDVTRNHTIQCDGLLGEIGFSCQNLHTLIVPAIFFRSWCDGAVHRRVAWWENLKQLRRFSVVTDDAENNNNNSATVVVRSELPPSFAAWASTTLEELHIWCGLQEPDFVALLSGAFPLTSSSPPMRRLTLNCARHCGRVKALPDVISAANLITSPARRQQQQQATAVRYPQLQSLTLYDTRNSNNSGGGGAKALQLFFLAVMTAYRSHGVDIKVVNPPMMM